MNFNERIRLIKFEKEFLNIDRNPNHLNLKAMFAL